jgi:precorrin-2/cobalt-factor-2 C20-methyltransferase
MKRGTLYGIGVGPGEPGLITVKGAEFLSSCRHVFVPKAREKAESVAFRIAGKYISPEAEVYEVLFPMTEDKDDLKRYWAASARMIAEILSRGEDACFLTLGDTLLYSTYIYLVRALREILPDARIVTIPGINSFSAAAALTGFPLGESRKPLIVIPAADDLESVRAALDQDGTVVLMKVGKRLREIIALLEEKGLIGESVFAARVGMEGERIETDMTKLKEADEKTGYLSVILVDAGKKGKA